MTMNRARVLITSVLVLLIAILVFFFKDSLSLNGNPDTQLSSSDTVTSVASLNSQGKRQFLDDVLSDLQTNDRNAELDSRYFQDTEVLFSDLAQLALDDSNRVAEPALFILNILALAYWDGGMEAGVSRNEPSLPTIPGIQDISQSMEVKTTLEQLVMGPDIEDEIRGRAIEIHSLLYPPQIEVIKRFDELIIESGDIKGDTLSAVFSAFTNYKSKYDYDMPISTLDATKTLIDHPSDSVKSSALYVLREQVGKPILPLLFYELEKTRNIGIANKVLMDIFALDQSDETVNKLEEIASKKPGSGIAMLIEEYTIPENIEHYRSISAKRANK